MQSQNKLAVREITENDLESIVDYFLKADKTFLTGMGVDTAKLPERKQWLDLLHNDLMQRNENKKAYYILWLLNNKPAGHSNISKIIFGEEAYMHLHMWNTTNRKNGIGSEFIKMSIPYYFNNFNLNKLYCEPYALNPAPNNTLKKTGFNFIERYTTVPGWVAFEQEVNRWCLPLEKV